MTLARKIVEEDYDVMDDEEFERQMMATRAKGMRSSVSAEVLAPSKNFKPPVHEKSAEQRDQIKQAVSKELVLRLMVSFSEGVRTMITGIDHDEPLSHVEE